MKKLIDIFKNGSSWIRADFHLHTKADKEFIYSGEENSFISLYVDKLKEQKIRLACITNHNKFDKNEFKALSKKSRKEEIYILPGVELSVNDGANGIHSLVVFNPKEWLENDTDFINQFLTQTFAGKSNYENENGRSNDSLIETIKKLDAFEKDYFIIMAHVEQKSGFYNELNGGRIKELGEHPIFQKSVLGFQKMRTREYKKNLELWLNNKLPAAVEGSDPKKIEDIGNAELTYLKVGAYNFEAIKYALLDEKFRQSKSLTPPTNSYIKTIAFTGGKMDGKTIQLNHSMNNLIGIRGSGKSSILEAIRYALDIELSEKENVDFKYKNGIVNSLLGSGGKITCLMIDDQGNEFTTEKILGDRTNIYKNKELQLGLKPSAIVKKPIYYGQKDLSKIGDSSSTKNLLNKLIGNRLLDKKRQVEEKNQDVLRLIDEIKKINSKIDRKPEIEAKQAELKLKIQVFKDNEIDKKLEKQISFNKDFNFIKRVDKFETKIIDALDAFIQEHDDGFESFHHYKSKENIDDVDKVILSLMSFEKIFDSLRGVLIKLIDKNEQLNGFDNNFTIKYNELKEEFSKIKREINLPNIQADDYVKYTKDLDLTKAQLSELVKLSNKKEQLQIQLEQTLVALQGLWHNEFEIIQEEIKKVNNDQDSVKINVDFKGNKEDFKSYLKENLRGSNLRENNIQSIVDNYADLINVHSDLSVKNSNIRTNLSDNQLHTFKEYFNFSFIYLY